MGLFGFGKKDKKVLDLSEKYRKQKEREKNIASDSAGSSQSSSQESSQSSGSNPFSFFESGNSSSADSGQENSDVVDLSNENVPGGGGRKKRLAKRILDMTNRLEDLSNQIYHLQQRIETLERKSGSGFGPLE